MILIFKKIIIGVVVIIIGLGGYFTWTFLSIPRVSYLTMQLEEAVETILVSGRVIGDGAVPLSFERSGRLQEVVVEEGDEVQSDELLALLDDEEAENLVKQSENQLLSAENALERLQNRDLPQARENLTQAEKRAEIAVSNFESAEENLDAAQEHLAEAEREETDARSFFEEQEKRYAEGEISSSELSEAEEELNLAAAELDRAEAEKVRMAREVETLARERDIALSQVRTAQNVLEGLENEDVRQAELTITQAENQLEQARLELDKARLEAPFRGVISSLSAITGQYVSTGEEICMIIPMASKTYIEAGVDEEFAGRVERGQEAIISSAAFPDKIYHGQVERVSATIDPDRGTFQVRFVLDQFEPDLLPDLAVSAEVVTTRTEQSLILEQGYTFRENEQVYVFIENDSLVEKRPVEIEDLGRGIFLIKEGLSVGDKVLTDLDLEDGQRIRLRE